MPSSNTCTGRVATKEKSPRRNPLHASHFGTIVWPRGRPTCTPAPPVRTTRHNIQHILLLYNIKRETDSFRCAISLEFERKDRMREAAMADGPGERPGDGPPRRGANGRVEPTLQ